MVMSDVDDLKETNDREGHAAGDALLKRVAQVLSASFRADEIIARIGGDEFAVLLHNTDATAAADALHRLEHVLQEYNAAYAGTLLRLSFGVSTAEKRTPLTDMLREADENMYRMKRGQDVLQKNHRQPKK
jgi:diguanylate cyclase (GGDEF)-like protein